MAQTNSYTPAKVNTFAGSGAPNNGTYGNSRDLLLKAFSGEMIKHFDEKFALKNGVRSISLNGGISAQFPAIGRASADTFIPGQEIIGQSIDTSAKDVTIDDTIISSVWINNIDEMLTHFEFRGEYSKQMASAMALTMERKLFQRAVGVSRLGDQFNAASVAGIDAATAAATGKGKGLVGMNNAVTKHVGTAGGAAELINAAFEAAAYFDMEDIPYEDRALYVAPSTYYALINSNDTTVSKLLDRDMSTNGDFAAAQLYQVAGFNLIKTNHMAINGTATVDGVSNFGPDGRTPLNAPTGGFGDDYAINASDTLGMFMHSSAIGMIKAQDMVTETEYSVAKQGTLLASKMLFGSDVLRPSALYEVRKAADA